MVGNYGDMNLMEPTQNAEAIKTIFGTICHRKGGIRCLSYLASPEVVKVKWVIDGKLK